jgi:molybdopterin-guanine dinucleotide biosynthesis protein A
MGMDKAMLEYDGISLVERSISIIKPVCSSILISTNNPELEYLGHALVNDIHRGIGPIAGLHSALHHSRAIYNVVIPCDMPLVTVDVFERLFAVASASHPPAVTAGTEDGFIEPLIGCYSREALPVLERQISNNNYKLHEALSLMRAETEIFKDKRLFWNINTRADISAVGGNSCENQRHVPYRSSGRKDYEIAAGARSS